MVFFCFNLLVFFPKAQRRISVYSLGVWGLDPCSRRVVRAVAVSSRARRGVVANSVAIGRCNFARLERARVWTFRVAGVGGRGSACPERAGV